MRVIQTAAYASVLVTMLMFMVAQVGAKRQWIRTPRRPRFTSYGRCQRQCVRSCRRGPAVQVDNPIVTDPPTVSITYLGCDILLLGKILVLSIK